MITHVNAQKCLRYLSEASKLDANAEIALSRDLLELYRTSLAFGKDLLKTELQPADDLALLAANGLVRAWSISGASDENHSRHLRFVLRKFLHF